MSRSNQVKNRDTIHHRWVRVGMNIVKCNICNLTKIESKTTGSTFYRDNICVENVGCIKIEKVNTTPSELRLRYLYNLLKKSNQNPSELDFGIVIIPRQVEVDCLFFKFDEDTLVVTNTRTLAILKSISIESRSHLREVVLDIVKNNN